MRPFVHPDEATPPNSIGLLVVYIMILVTFNVFSMLETVTAPLLLDTTGQYTDSFGWK
jgi:hypothetical protein